MTVTPTHSPSPSRVRIITLAGVLGALFALGKLSGWSDSGVDGVRALVDRAGAFGYLAYAAVFSIGELVHVPGVVFVVAGVVAFGHAAGFVVALAGAVVSVSVTFFVVRTLGGRPLGSVERPFVKRVLSHLDENPIRTVFLLRLVLWLAPALNYALALSNVRYRDYLVGSLLGLVLPIGLVTLFVDRVAAYLLH